MSIVLRIIVKENQTGFTEKYKKELISYLNNSMRHIADDWEIKEVNKETEMFFDYTRSSNQPAPPKEVRKEVRDLLAEGMEILQACLLENRGRLDNLEKKLDDLKAMQETIVETDPVRMDERIEKLGKKLDDIYGEWSTSEHDRNDIDKRIEKLEKEVKKCLKKQ